MKIRSMSPAMVAGDLRLLPVVVPLSAEAIFGGLVKTLRIAPDAQLPIKPILSPVLKD